MSDTPENKGGAPADPSFGGRLEITVGGAGASQADLGGEDVKVLSKERDGTALDVGDDGVEVAGLAGTEKPEGGEEAPKADANDKAEGEGEKGGEKEPEAEGEKPAAPEPLPAFAADNEEVVKAYDERYFSAPDPDGGEGKVLNLAAFNPELEANLLQGKAELNEDTYKYLKSKLGISRDAAQAHVNAVVEQAQKAWATIFDYAGGREAYEAKREWALKNYSKEQVASLDAAFAKGGTDLEDALDFLDMKYSKATGKAATEKKSAAETPAPQKERRPVTPKVDATAGASSSGAGAVQGYATYTEYRRALAEAGEDDAKRAEVNRKAKASKWV